MGRVNTEQDFWKHVDSSEGPEACWPWKSTRSKYGYGQWYWQGEVVRSHRMAWFFSHKEEPVPDVLLHTCDNPPCCNLRHLKGGLQKDNMQDMYRKGRQARAYGENTSNSKLVVAQVIDILNLFFTEHRSHGQIAREYGVSRPCISDILNGKTWKEVSTPYMTNTGRYKHA